MKLLSGARPFLLPASGLAATAGNFDGVHLGHQTLLSELRKAADQQRLPLAVLLFEPQPAEFFLGKNAPARLTGLRDKIRFLSEFGVDYVYCLRFNATLAAMPAEAFAKKYLFTLLQVRYWITGEDFRFGKNREGDVSLLQSLAAGSDCQIATLPDFMSDKVRISSTRIRQMLAAGDLTAAAQMLGRSWSICGRVVKGQGLGRQWGIPTVNLSMKQRAALPLRGVFCVRVKTSRGDVLRGVANIGSRPTVDGSKQVLEVHILDFDQMIYGEFLEVIFLNKLRDEVRYASVDRLIEQIREDIRVTRTWFDSQ